LKLTATQSQGLMSAPHRITLTWMFSKEVENMRKRSRESLPGFSAPVLTAPILSGIHRLNLDYVEMLIDEGEHPLAMSLPVSVREGLSTLSAAARSAVAACPFALYSLRLEQSELLRTAVRSQGMTPVEAGHSSRDSLSRQSAFAISALFFAWHVANSQPLAARVFYALSEPAIDVLVHTSLAALQRAACDEPGLLEPRWPTNCAFWPDLVRFAALGDSQRLTTTQLLGSQLIAADLRANAATRMMARPSIRNPPLQPAAIVAR
jgi:hypothetical protein